MRDMIKADCEFIAEEEMKKLADPAVAEKAIGEKCASSCGFIWTGDKSADKLANEEKWKAEMEGNDKLKT